MWRSVVAADGGGRWSTRRGTPTMDPPGRCGGPWWRPMAFFGKGHPPILRILRSFEKGHPPTAAIIGSVAGRRQGASTRDTHWASTTLDEHSTSTRRKGVGKALDEGHPPWIHLADVAVRGGGRWWRPLGHPPRPMMEHHGAGTTLASRSCCRLGARGVQRPHTADDRHSCWLFDYAVFSKFVHAQWRSAVACQVFSRPQLGP